MQCYRLKLRKGICKLRKVAGEQHFFHHNTYPQSHTVQSVIFAVINKPTQNPTTPPQPKQKQAHKQNTQTTQKKKTQSMPTAKVCTDSRSFMCLYLAPVAPRMLEDLRAEQPFSELLTQPKGKREHQSSSLQVQAGGTSLFK